MRPRRPHAQRAAADIDATRRYGVKRNTARAQEPFTTRLSLFIDSLRSKAMAHPLEQTGEHRRRPVGCRVGESKPAKSLFPPEASDREQQIEFGTNNSQRRRLRQLEQIVVAH